jgi:hypothetical protein
MQGGQFLQNIGFGKVSDVLNGPVMKATADERISFY